MNKNFVVAVASAVVCGSLILLQQRRIERLMAQNTSLNAEVNRMASVEGTIEHVSEQLRATTETMGTNESELMRLRAQASRLREFENQNAQLSSQVQVLGQQMRELRL